MVSSKHQFIIDCIIRKMRYLGFEPVCIDGNSTLVSSLNIPQTILRHRPDVIGVDVNNNICIGEAKTENDVQSKRTKEQIVDFTNAGICVLFGCPKSTYAKLTTVITELVPNEHCKNIILGIPDELMSDDEI